MGTRLDNKFAVTVVIEMTSLHMRSVADKSLILLFYSIIISSVDKITE